METHLVPIVYNEGPSELLDTRIEALGHQNVNSSQESRQEGTLMMGQASLVGQYYDTLRKFSTGGEGVKNYELLRQVGRGGFSRVILARQRKTGILCAMKVISIEELLTHGKIN